MLYNFCAIAELGEGVLNFRSTQQGSRMPEVTIQPRPELEEPSPQFSKRPFRSSILVLTAVVCLAILIASVLFFRHTTQLDSGKKQTAPATLGGEIRIKGTTEA